MMCGRYRIKATDELTEHLRRTFGIPRWVEDQNRPRYNIAPSQVVPVIWMDPARQLNRPAEMDDEGNVVVPAVMRWGFVPYWAKSEKPKLAPINAKAESIVTSAMFRQSLQKRRCLVPADGFYEWRRIDERLKVPYDIHVKGNGSFFMAGIFEKPTELRPATFAVITTSANELMAKIHDRMPAILDDEEAKRWLMPGSLTADDVAQLTEPYPSSDIEAVVISTLVNNPRNDGPELLEPVAYSPPTSGE